MIWSFESMMKLLHMLFKWEGNYVGCVWMFLLNEIYFGNIYEILGNILTTIVGQMYVVRVLIIVVQTYDQHKCRSHISSWCI
jgi:hypothetical protein